MCGACACMRACALTPQLVAQGVGDGAHRLVAWYASQLQELYAGSACSKIQHRLLRGVRKFAHCGCDIAVSRLQPAQQRWQQLGRSGSGWRPRCCRRSHGGASCRLRRTRGSVLAPPACAPVSTVPVEQVCARHSVIGLAPHTPRRPACCSRKWVMKRGGRLRDAKLARF
jgi:hypothetical protein